MKRVLILLLSIVSFLLQPIVSMAQLFEPTFTFPPSPSLPNYGTPNNQAIRSNWNIVSILNAIIAASVANNPNIDLNASFVVNNIVGNIATADKYGPTQNGFYLNDLVFESEPAKGFTLFGQARLQDDFNKFGNFNVRNGHLKYDLQYSKMINRQIAPDFFPNAGSSDVTPLFGWPDLPGFPQFTDDLIPFVLPGFNPNAFFYPRIDDFLSNYLQYVWDNGFGIFASNWLRSQTGSTLFQLDQEEGPVGRDNNLSVTVAGLNYTSPYNLQLYWVATDRNWNNKQQYALWGAPLPGLISGGPPAIFSSNLVIDPTTGIIKEPCYPNSPIPGTCLDFTGFLTVPNFKVEDTFWQGNNSGLRVPISKSVSFSASWEKLDKTTAGVFPTANPSDFFDGESPPPVDVATLVLNGPDASEGLIPTGLQPHYVLNQYRGTLNWLIGDSSYAFLDFGHWEEDPNASVLHETNRSRNNIFGSYFHSFGEQSVSLYGGWEEETVERTVDYREIRIVDAFNPIYNTSLDNQYLGTAVWNGLTVSFTPNPGTGIASFTTPVPYPCVLGLQYGCGTNLITYPVGGIENIPGVGPIPVVAPLGRRTLKFNNYLVRLMIDGPILGNLNYNITIRRQFADNALFRTDPQNEWDDHFELNWNPDSTLVLNASLDTQDNKSLDTVWIYPYKYHDNTFSFTTNYQPLSSFSLFAGYHNYTQKIDFTDPVFNTWTENFIGPPNFGPFGPIPTTGSPQTIILNPFVQYLTQPLNNYETNVRDQDQEITFGFNYNIAKDWQMEGNYTHSRPQVFQNIFMTNPVIVNSPFGPFSPNTQDGFLASLPELDLMQKVDGRGNSYQFSVFRNLEKDARLGFMLQLSSFKDLAPHVTAISIACGAPNTPTFCSDGTPYGLNSFQYGPSLNNGQIFSTSITYIKNF